jgi:hypothetical protein
LSALRLFGQSLSGRKVTPIQRSGSEDPPRQC